MSSNGSYPPKSHQSRNIYHGFPRAGRSSTTHSLPPHRPGRPISPHLEAQTLDGHARTPQSQSRSDRTAPTASMDSPDGTARSRTRLEQPKKSSGGFLIGGALGHKLRRSSRGAKTRREGPLGELESDNRISSSPPSSARSAKSLGKAPLANEYLGLDGNKTPDRSVSAIGRNSWAPSASTGRNSGTSQSSAADAALDSNQLIQMALSLSEGRKRVASGIYAPPAMATNRASISHAQSAPLVKAGSPYGNDTVRRRTRLSQDLGYSNSKPSEPEMPLGGPLKPTSWADEVDVSYEFSISCLQRAERAKKYFELSDHYRRLLESLPPLRSRGATADGTHHITLGREFNPLQFLRNERVRQRAGVRLLPGPDEFEDIDQVEAYVNATEQVRTQYRSADASQYPPLPDIRYFQGQAKSPNTKQHTRNNTASSKVLWFDSQWTFTPMALLADVVWTDDWRNKWVIENRFGAQLFPNANSPVLSQGRSPQGNHGPKRSTTSDDMVDGADQKRGRRKRKFLSIHKLEQETAKVLHWHRGRSRSRSAGSTASTASTYGTQGQLTNDGINIGPLTRHMQHEMQQADLESVSADGQWDDLPEETEWKQTRRPPVREPRGGSVDRHRLDTRADVTGSERAVRSAVEPSTDYQKAIDNGRSVFDDMESDVEPINDNKRYIGQTDFADAEPLQSRQSAEWDDGRSVHDAEARERHRRQESYDRGQRGKHTSESVDGSTKGVNKAISRILKDSVIVGILRKEGPRKAERDDRKGGVSNTTTSSVLTDDDDLSGDEEPETCRQGSGASSTTQFRTPHDAPLPSFKFPPRGGSGGESNLTGPELPTSPPISRHPSARMPRLEIPKQDRKPVKEDAEAGSSSMLSLLSPIKRLRNTRSPLASRAQSTAGSTTSLAPRPGPPKRKWSIANDLDRAAKSSTITARDIERVRTLFLSSGIKAAQLCRLAGSIPAQAAPELVAAAKAAHRHIPQVCKHNEPRHAARLWQEAIRDLQRESEAELGRYRDQVLPDMRHGINALRLTAGEDLSSLLRRTGDDADAFAAEVGGVQTLAVKQCHDTIDALLRRRRRGARLVRRLGWKGLEVVLVLIMWALWGLFLVYRIVRSVVRGLLKTGRWLVPM